MAILGMTSHRQDARAISKCAITNCDWSFGGPYATVERS